MMGICIKNCDLCSVSISAKMSLNFLQASEFLFHKIVEALLHGTNIL